MKPRMNYFQAAPDTLKALMALEAQIQSTGIEKSLIELVKIRASQINGCAFCVDMHVKEARHDGLSEQWINLMCAWRESPVYGPRERALLGWVDAVTNIASTGAPDAEYQALQAHFTEEEIVKVTLAIGTINVWNRLAVGLRFQHPIDQPAKAA